LALLFRACGPLLENSRNETPKFVVVDSDAGTIGVGHPFPLTAYGASKTAMNFCYEADTRLLKELVRFPGFSWVSGVWYFMFVELVMCC
jgi:hypothetical protein